MSILDLQNDSMMNQAEGSKNKQTPTKAQLSDDFKRALDQIPQMVWLTKAGIGYANSILKNYIGSESQDLHHRDWIRCLHPEDAEHFYNIWMHAQKSGQSFEKECRIKGTNGEYFWFLVNAKSNSNSGQFYDWTVSFTNIHERAVQLRETADMLRANTDMLDVSVDCIKIITPTGQVSHMNKSGCRALLGKERVRKFGMEWLGLLPPEVRDQGSKAIKIAAKGQNSRFAGKSVSGNITMYWDNILIPVINESGETSSILCVSRDITLQRVAKNKLKISSEYDELTGLMNRRSFKAKLKQSIAHAKRTKTKVGMMFIDLDHFKNINDTLGHSAGDHLLRVLSKRFSKCLDENAYVSRLGGDEFAVIVTNLKNVEHLEQVSKQLLKRNESPVTFAGKLINGGMSIGGAIFPQDATEGIELMKCADTALNDLKERGRGGFRLYNTEMMEVAEQKTQQLETARYIIREQLIEPFYQPKVRLDNREIIGFEALLRWKDSEAKVYFPATIVEAFNDYELATKISLIMHERIFTDMSNWMNQDLRVVPISINASPVEFMRDNYAELLIKRLEQYQIPPQLIEIEITEHILSERGSEFVIRALKKLKEYGIRISLDDFGTGHSSMTHLRDYPVDCLKIDYAFVNRMNEEKSISSIVEGIAKLGPILSLDVIAEGIEAVEQLDSLQLVGCQFGQGFLFSRAICASEAKSMLMNKIIE